MIHETVRHVTARATPSEPIEMRKPEKWNSGIIILQFLVCALVLIGGLLFATYAVNFFGTTLGFVHVSIGILGITGGIAILLKRTWSRVFVISANVLTISYSSFSESIVQIESLLPSFAFLGSLIGTIITIIMSCSIIYIFFKTQKGWNP